MGKDIKDFGLPHLDESCTFFTMRVIMVMIMKIRMKEDNNNSI
jgi:hypothetical protein